MEAFVRTVRHRSDNVQQPPPLEGVFWGIYAQRSAKTLEFSMFNFDFEYVPGANLKILYPHSLEKIPLCAGALLERDCRCERVSRKVHSVAQSSDYATFRNQFKHEEMSMENSGGATTKADDALSSGSKRVQSMGKQGLDVITDMTSQARDVASNAGESIIAYTKENPVKALAVAAAAGALLYAAIKASAASRN